MSDHRGVTAPEPPETDDHSVAGPGHSPPARRRSIRRVGVLLVVASFVGVWGYVMYLSIFEGRAEPRDRLDDTQWVAAAEETCAESLVVLDDMPYASEIDSPAERAMVLDAVTDELEVMVTRVRGLVPPADADEARAVRRWLDDWDEFNRNRRAYADRFRAGLDEPFRVTDRAGYQIDVLIRDFAVINIMESCAPPGDVG